MEKFNIFTLFANLLDKIIFFEIFGFPFLIILLLFTGLYLTFKIGFPNVKLFKHGLEVAFKNKYTSADDPGDIMPRSSLFTSISSSVGLGSISGVAIAISIGGPGAVVWMLIMSFFSMSIVFTEVALSQKYRSVNSKGEYSGNPYRYLTHGLRDIGYEKLGKILAITFSICSILGLIGSGAFFQVHESIGALTSLKTFQNLGFELSIIFTIIVAVAMAGGIKIITKITDRLVPLMTLIYLVCSIIIIAVNFKNLPNALLTMITGIFGYREIGGGIIGTMVIGIKRMTFSSEAGMGTTPIAHAAAKTKYAVRQASIAAVNPLAVAFFCFLTGLVITISGVYRIEGVGDGVVMTVAAFNTVSEWFPKILAIVITLFGLSTALGYTYYAQILWSTLFKNKKSLLVFNIVYCISVFIANKIEFGQVVKIADTFFFSGAIPNCIGLILLSGMVKGMYKEYYTKLKSGEFDNTNQILEADNKVL